MIYKIPHQSYTLSLLMAIFFHFSSSYSQQTVISKYGTPVLNSISDYRATVKKEPLKRMVELKQSIPGIVYDLRYAGSTNFIGRPLYPIRTTKTYLRIKAAEALAKVQEELYQKNLGLIIFDAYRPYSVTVTFWELIKDERYVAHPAKGSGHNRGLAIDLSIINLSTGKELKMGTGFDNFSDSAHHSFTKLPEEILKNRILFKEVMLKYGFQLFETEWWHYSWPNDKDYEVMDIPFKKLKSTVLTGKHTPAGKKQIN